jgi:protein-S-isoprenylcysteine O-methyltransferase Ste14
MNDSIAAKRKVLPPTYLLVSIVTMIALRLLFPGPTVIALPWALLGLLPAVMKLSLSIVADRAFKKSGTTVKPFEESTALVTSGAYGLSRHPMYLGFTMLLLGLAVCLGALAPFLVVPVFAILMDINFIRAEEQMMETTFSQAWHDYKQKVRRWI